MTQHLITADTSQISAPETDAKKPFQLRVAVLISGSGSNLQALIDASHTPNYPADIALVISNKKEAYGLKRAEKAGIPAQCIDHQAFATREAFEEQIEICLQKAGIDLICLAGFMRILTPQFVSSWRGRLLNIHPSLLPAYKGLNTHARARADKVEKHGCSVHLVTADLDAGPVLAQGIFALNAQEEISAIEKRVHHLEHQIYPLALQYWADTLLSKKRFIRQKGSSLSEEDLKYMVKTDTIAITLHED